MLRRTTDHGGNGNPIDFRDCRAKTCADGSPGTTVFDHCRYAGATAGALAGLLVPSVRRRLPKHVDLCVALHDVGKVSPGFQGKYFKSLLQKYAPEWCRRFELGATNGLHAEVGAAALKRFLRQLEDDHPLVVSAAAHHGSAPQRIDLLADGPEWQAARENLIQALEKEFGATCRDGDIQLVDAGLLTGLTCVADWLSSDEEFFAPEEQPLDAAALAGRVSAALSIAGFRSPNVVKGLSFEDVFGFSPRDEQRALFDQVSRPGVYVMEATMGAGKTEAALYAAYKMWASGQNNGLYFALPTRLTSDWIHERVERFAERVFDGVEPVRLSHGQAWLKERPHGREGCCNRVPPWFSPSKRGLLYPLAVGTIDQALLSVMNVKHAFVRRFGLAGKVVVLDEVHSYDLYTGTLLDLLVRELRALGCTVIILSATLTTSRRASILGLESIRKTQYPCVTVLNEEFETGRFVEPEASRTPVDVRVAWLDENVDALVADALGKARAGCNVLCIANTVKRAQEWYWRLLQSMTEDDAWIRIGLLHSRFPSFRRAAIESEWMSALGKESDSRPTGSILVATQIVEQSVDIDADYMISELAPIDMLFQRMGRLWRHARPSRPMSEPTLSIALAAPHPGTSVDDVEALLESFGRGTAYVYAPFVLERTYRCLRRCTTLNVPGDIRALLENVYEDGSEQSDPVLVAFREQMEEQAEMLRRRALSAGVGKLSMPCRKDDDDNPPTRYGTQVQAKLLLVRAIDDGVARGSAELVLEDGRSLTVSEMKRDFAATRALFANVVSAPMSQCCALQGRRAETPWLAQHFLASDMPIVAVVGQNGELRVNGEEARLVYRADLGVCASREGWDSYSPRGEGASACPVDFIEGTDW